MRVWHKALLSVLPDKQLVAQWREICSIARNIDLIGTPNHVLVNPIMDYPLSHLYSYTLLVIEEMGNRGFTVSNVSYANYEKHMLSAMEKLCDTLETIPFNLLFYDPNDIKHRWHNEDYFWQCIFNLQEKYQRGILTDDEWNNIEEMSRLYVNPVEYLSQLPSHNIYKYD